MTICIVGIGGAIGNAVAKTLIATGHETVGISRTAKTGLPEGLTHCCLDRTDLQAMRAFIERNSVHTVIDFAAMSAASTTPLLTRLDAHVERYVLISSGDVYRRHGEVHRLEDASGAVTPLAETAPLRTRLYPYRKAEPRPFDSPDAWLDTYDKIPIENDVRKLTCDWVICRLPMVYGAEGPLRRFDWAIRPMQADAARLTLPRAWLNWVTTYGYVDNIAAAIGLCATAPRAPNGIFNLVDFPAMSHRDWLGLFAAKIGWQGRIEPGEHPALSAAIAELDLTVPLNLSGEKLWAELGFQPPVSRVQAIQAMLDT